MQCRSGTSRERVTVTSYCGLHRSYNESALARYVRYENYARFRRTIQAREC